MEIIRDITALEELPEAAATGLGRGGNSNGQGWGNTNCQGTGATCGWTCGNTSSG